MERWSVSGDRLDLGRQEQNLTRDVRFRVDRNDRRVLGARAPGQYGEGGDEVSCERRESP